LMPGATAPMPTAPRRSTAGAIGATWCSESACVPRVGRCAEARAATVRDTARRTEVEMDGGGATRGGPIPRPSSPGGVGASSALRAPKASPAPPGDRGPRTGDNGPAPVRTAPPSPGAA
jgi:hypothetical protein